MDPACFTELCGPGFLQWSNTLSVSAAVRPDPTHLDDLDGLFDLLQFLGSLLDQVFELRPLLTQVTLR